MTPAVISVLTNGLTCGVTSACDGGTTMTAGLFTLWCDELPPDRTTSGGGHARPNNLSAHARATRPNISYPQSDPDLIYIDPNKVMGRRVPVKVTFKMGERKVEKVYSVSIDNAHVLIKVMNLVTTYKKKLIVKLTKLQKKRSKISVLYKRGRSFISKRHDFD